MEIKIINKSNHRLPEYKTPLSAGMDLKANISDPVKLNPMERILIPTGLYIALPEGYGADIKTRSGLALKYGIIQQSGAWFTFIDLETGELIADEDDEVIKVQGKPNLVTFLTENESFLKEIKDKVYSLIERP